MGDAPERIWLTADRPDHRPFVTKGFLASPPRTEYIRADLVPQWQPIETAPRDGRWVLRYDPRLPKNDQVFQTRSDGGFWVYEKIPGAWMPLPQPPSGDK